MPFASGSRRAFTLIELLVVIAIIAILAVVVVLTLNPAQLLAESRDANRVSDMATLQSALNLYTTDQSGNLQLGNVSSTYISVPDPNASTTCGSLGLLSLNTSTGQYWTCSSSSNYRLATSTGWLGVNFNLISSGSPFGSEPIDPVNQTSTGLFYAYNTNGSQFQVTADLESSKYKSTYGNNPPVQLFPQVVSGGTPGISALYNPSGLVGYWPLNEGNGSSTVDLSGNGDNGTWGGTPIGSGGTYYTGGKIGTYAGDFNGSNDYVSLGNPSALQVANLTVSAWVNPSALTIFEDIVANYNAGSVNQGAFMLRCNNVSGACNALTFYIQNASANVSSIAGSFATPGIWYFVTATYNGSRLNIYINGALSATNSGSATLSYSNNIPWLIGASGSSTAEAAIFNGAIDDVRIYNRALSAAEVAALYNAGR